MLTKTQTDIEKRDELYKDKDELLKQSLSIPQRADYIRACKKAKRFPFDYMAHYKSKRGNRYTIIVTPTDRKKGSSNPLFSYHTTLETKEGRYMLRYDLVTNNVNIFTPHFFKRYRERLLKSSTASAEDIITTFARRNPNTAQTINGDIKACNEGYIFAKPIGEGISVCVTFLSFDMLREDQMETSERLLEVINQHEESLKL